MRLDLAAARAFGLSRRAARDAVRAGRIDVEGVPRDEPGLDVPGESSLSLHPDRPVRRRVRSPLTVLWEDDDVLVVDKPAGLLTVPTAAGEKDTLLSRARGYLLHRYGRRPYVGIVHRLDRDTSGAIAFARTRPAHGELQALFRRHRIEREYVAIVEGQPPDSGRFETPLARGRDLRRRVARRGEEGKRAVTRYRTLERWGGAALVSVELETGRTHQIRVHFAEAGHPVLGDTVYRRPDAAPPLEVPRQMLHARSLAFAHPGTGGPVSVTTPPPADFSRALDALRRKSAQKKAPREARGASESRGRRR